MASISHRAARKSVKTVARGVVAPPRRVTTSGASAAPNPRASESSPRQVAVATPPLAATDVPAERATTTPPEASAPSAAPPKQSQRLITMLDHVNSVQKPRDPKKPMPKWFKIGTWLVMLMPAYAIVIYIVGFFYFLPFEQRGVGVNASLGDTPTATVNHVLVPDQEGVFLQHASGATVKLDQILAYVSETLQPPLSAQMVMAPTDLKYVVIRYAQVLKPDAYQVYRIGNGPNQLVAVAGQRLPIPRMAVIALAMPNGQAWAPGSYEMVVPESGLDSVDNYCYFTIAAPGK